MVDYQEIFIKNLKKIRKSQNITQAQLAELCDVSNGTIGNIECGVTKPSFDLFLKFAEKLNVSPTKFFYTEDSESKERKETLTRIKNNLIEFIESEFR